MRLNKREVGASHEKLAGAYLETQGYLILEYNFRSRRSEIDIVARDGEYLVFVEVKYRSDERNGDPLEAVDVRKQKRICQAARYYLMIHHLNMDTPCRFDVAAVRGQKVELVKNAFYYIE